MTKRRMAFILAAMLTLTCAFDGKALAASVEPEDAAVAVEARQEETVSEEVTEEVTEEVADEEPEVTDDAEVVTEDTTETAAAEEPAVMEEEPVEATEETAVETSEEGVTEDVVETAAEEEPKPEAAEAEAEEEEIEETGTAKDAKAMWHGMEYDSKGNVVHYWISQQRKSGQECMG